MSYFNQELEDRNQALFSKLVPMCGKCDTLEGEVLRAINRIAYRFYNDGDFFFAGYGCETVGPAHAFLVDQSPLSDKLNPIFKEIVWTSEEKYKKGVEKALEIVLDYVESANGSYHENNLDCLDFEPHYEDEEEICNCCGETYYNCGCDEYCEDDEYDDE